MKKTVYIFQKPINTEVLELKMILNEASWGLL